MGWPEQEVVSLLRLSLIPSKRYTLHTLLEDKIQNSKFKIQNSTLIGIAGEYASTNRESSQERVT